jgi:hypothetical protein
MDGQISESDAAIQQVALTAPSLDSQIVNIKSTRGAFRPSVVILTAFLGTIAVTIITIVIISVSASLPKLPPWAWCAAIGIVIGSGLVVYGRHMRARVKRLPHIFGLTDIEHLAKEYQRVAGLRFWDMGPFVAELAKIGRVNLVIRFYKKEPHLEIAPLSVVFDPCAIDESQHRFVELSMENAARDIRWEKEKDLPPKSSFARQLIVKGGWLIIFCSGFNALIAGIDSLQRGRITWQLVMWSANILIFLFVPTTGLFGTGKQFFLVNGGVLRRQRRKKGQGSDLHVYSRGKSNLGVIEMGRRQRRWMAYVADKDFVDYFVVTASEGRMLLRAWLSPVDPPLVERLKDFE